MQCQYCNNVQSDGLIYCQKCGANLQNSNVSSGAPWGPNTNTVPPQNNTWGQPQQPPQPQQQNNAWGQPQQPPSQQNNNAWGAPKTSPPQNQNSAWGTSNQQPNQPPPQQSAPPPQQQSNSPGYITPAAVQAESKSTTALVLSLIGFFLPCVPILSILGLVFGFQAKKMLSDAKRPNGNAVAAIVFGFLGLTWIAGIILYWIFCIILNLAFLPFLFYI